jgi:hypothetical protein
MFGKAVDRQLGGFDQTLDLGRTLRIVAFGRLTALFDLNQTMAQCSNQCFAPFAVIEQVIFQVGVALDDPDVAQHLVEHARRTAGDALARSSSSIAQLIGAEQADDDLAIGKRSVVVRYFAQAGSHGSNRGSVKK